MNNWLMLLWSRTIVGFISRLIQLSLTGREKCSCTRLIRSKMRLCISSTLTFCVLFSFILDESAIPFSILNYALNPFDMVWYWTSFMLYFSPALVIPRIWYFADFKWHPRKLFLLRGGRVLKVEAQSVGNERLTYWLETRVITPMTEDKMRFDDREEADFLTEEGQLKYDLTVET